MIAPVLQSGRVRLRPHRIEDFQRLVEMFASPRSQYMDVAPSRAIVWRNFSADVGQWVLLGFGSWAVDDLLTGVYVGQVGLNFPVDFPEHELGWQVWEQFEGKGYAFEAAMLAREFAFGALDWPTVVSYIDPENIRSIRLAERMGAELDRNAATPNNEACLVYRHMRPVAAAR